MIEVDIVEDVHAFDVLVRDFQRGKDCVVLYTDLSNPTSNSIYQKLGYRPVCEWKNYRITE
jgi:ribosomal protein S18 acetylase RimI-like enzyme